MRLMRRNPLKMTTRNMSVLSFNLSFLFHRHEVLAEGMEALLEGFKAGRLRSPRVTTYPLQEVAAAHQAIESGETVGKLVLIP